MDVQEKLKSVKELIEICPVELKVEYERLDEILTRREEQVDLEKLPIKLKYDFNLVESKLIIIRHAFAWHNYIKKGFDYDKKEVYSNFLMDPPLHPIGEKQCEFLQELVNKIDFNIIFVSPLKRYLIQFLILQFLQIYGLILIQQQRAVQTAEYAFKRHPNRQNIKFVILPLATEKVGSQYSIFRWSRWRELEESGMWDLTFFNDFNNKSLWQMEMLNKQIKLNKQQDLEIQQENYLIENYVRKGQAIRMEENKEVFERAQKVKELIRQQQGRVGIISHSVLLKCLMSSELEQNETVQKSIQLQNGTLKCVDI